MTASSLLEVSSAADIIFSPGVVGVLFSDNPHPVVYAGGFTYMMSLKFELSAQELTFFTNCCGDSGKGAHLGGGGLPMSELSAGGEGGGIELSC